MGEARDGEWRKDVPGGSMKFVGLDMPLMAGMECWMSCWLYIYNADCVDGVTELKLSWRGVTL